MNTFRNSIYIKINEFHIYGSSRLGVYESNEVMAWRSAFDANNDNQLSETEYSSYSANNSGFMFANLSGYRGKIRYEMSNHLGNVLTVVSDKKLAVCSSGTFVSYAAEVISATDYSPFGAPLAGRTYQASEYRFGFNGKENDNEVKGSGNQQDYGLRVYDTRIAKFLSVDPLFKDFAWNSTYAFAENNPIRFIDLDGGEKKSPKLLCTNFKGLNSHFRGWSLPHIKLISSERVREQHIIYERTINLEQPAPGVGLLKKLFVGNSDQTVVDYNMYDEPDKLKVVDKKNKPIVNTDFVSNTGHEEVSTENNNITVEITTGGGVHASEYKVDITHNDRRVFEKKNYYLFGNKNLKVWSTKVEMYSAKRSNYAIKASKAAANPIPESDNLKKEFENQEGIRNDQDYQTTEYEK